MKLRDYFSSRYFCYYPGNYTSLFDDGVNDTALELCNTWFVQLSTVPGISSVKLIKFKSPHVYLYLIFYSFSYTVLFYFYQYPRCTEVDKDRLIRILNK